jgi:hypothetical protein
LAPIVTIKKIQTDPVFGDGFSLNGFTVKRRAKLAAVRVALATPSGDDEWSAYSNALGRKFLKLAAFLKPATSASDSSQPGEPKPQAQKLAAAAAKAPESAAKPAKSEEPGFLRKLFS